MDKALIDHIQPFRDRIDAIDDILIELMAERAECVRQVGAFKRGTGRPVYRPEREVEIIRRMQAANPGPLTNEAIDLLWTEIMSACRSLEGFFTIAYLGPEGTFSEEAAIAHFGSVIHGLPCASIDDVFRAVESQVATFGMVPLENSSEGAVNRSLDALLATPLIISGERSIPIEHMLLTRSGTLDEATQVCAHSQALAQCQGWLSQHCPQLQQRAVASNAEAAKLASDDPTIAAIASKRAAQRYQLQPVAGGIQDDAHNRTRFVAVGTLETWPSGSDKTSLVLSVANRAGAVHELLAPLAAHGVSMTRLESRPARTGQWEYYFFVDIEGHQRDENVAQALNELRRTAAFFKVLGSYPV